MVRSTLAQARHVGDPRCIRQPHVSRARSAGISGPDPAVRLDVSPRGLAGRWPPPREGRPTRNGRRAHIEEIRFVACVPAVSLGRSEPEHLASDRRKPDIRFFLYKYAMHPIVVDYSSVVAPLVAYLQGFAITAAVGVVIGICAALGVKTLAANRGMNRRAQGALAQGVMLLCVVVPLLVYVTTVRP